MQLNAFSDLLLQFIVSKNLTLALVERASFFDLIFNISLATFVSSRRTLECDLEQTFTFHRDILKAEMAAHVQNGGRLSPITNLWTASNTQQYTAIMVH